MEHFGGNPLIITRYLLVLLFTRGLPVTLSLAVIGFIFAVTLGFFVGLLRFLKVPVVNLILQLYVDGMRGLPFLMVLYFIFYVLPFFNLQLDAFWTAITALTLHTGAYISEIIRGSLLSIPKLQHEAAQSLAMSTWQRLRYIIIPQAVRISLPPLSGQVVLHIKDTSVVSIIAVTELTRVARVQMQSNMQPLLTFALLAVFYFAACYPILRLSRGLEHRVARQFHQ